MNSDKTIKNILVDIEGTTSSISFVHEVLFPYAKDKLKTFITKNFNKPEVHQVLMETLSILKLEAKDQEQIINDTSKALLHWINEDKKIKALKDLQGLIWEDGYRSSDFHGHLYDDAYHNLTKWKEQGYQIYVYSSGSIKAQKLLFAHTEHGDLNKLFSANFDTKIGAKKDPESYTKISQGVNAPIESILFLSDNEDELIAAHKAGMQVIKLARPEDKIKASNSFKSVENFDSIQL